ncbi:hypothetical protein EBZ37_12510 [bacterium]|nr:hypothetical protein [bacterium]
MAVQGLDESEYAMGVTAEHKWFNELTKLVIVKRSATSSVVTGESTRIGNDIENTVLAKLSAADRKKFIDYQGAVSWSFSVQRDPISWAEKLIVVASSMHPKMDDPTLEITAKLVLKKQANGISIVAESAKLVEKK